MRKRIVTTLALAGFLALIGGCGEGGQDKSGEAASAPEPRQLAADEGPSGAMTYWGQKIDIKCPARFDIPDRAADAPVDDIRGLRLGVAGATAILFAQCKDGVALDSIYLEDNVNFKRNAGGLKIRTGASVTVGILPDRWRQARNPLERDATKLLSWTNDQWYFVMDGMPGKERLYAMWLEQPFGQGTQPTVESQLAALKAKYGEPNYTDDRGRLYWLHQPDGKPIPLFNRTLLHTCHFQISTSHRSLSYGPECGTIITADVQRDRNDLLARNVILAVFNPAALFEYQSLHFEDERDELLAREAAATAAGTTGGNF